MSEEIYEKAIDDLYKELKEKIIKQDDTSGNKIEFIKKHMDELFSTTFWDFAQRDEYGDIDGDREKISSAIYWILWGDKLKEINRNYTYKNFDYKLENDLVPDEKFSGDTICTFNTLFSGASIAWFENQNFDKEIDRTDLTEKYPLLSIFSNQELKGINDFRLLYQTLGNFYILPKKTIGKKTSLNSYRGNIKLWKDYFDLFLENLEIEFRAEITNKEFHNLIIKNNFFFAKYNSLKDFSDLFYLNDFENYNFSKHYDSYDYNKQDYVNFALEYIDKSSKCIEKRAERMKNALIKKLGLDN